MIINTSVNVKNLKIPAKFCFSPKKLSSYLKTVKKWGSLEYEIAAGLSFLKVYSEIVPGGYLIYFIPKDEAILDLSTVDIDINDMGNFLRKIIKNDTLTDVCLVRPESGIKAGVVPLQIKRFGLGRERGANTKAMIDFLMKCSLFSPNPNKLIIVLEKFGKLNPQELVNWLNSNKFPFPEVVLIYIHKDLKMEFFQLKPNRGTFSTKSLSKEQVMTDFDD